MFELRPYQKDAVAAVISHFRKNNEPAVVVLPTGAGKSLVIAELARVAKGRVLCLAHVKELVEQNHGKFESYGPKAGIFSAGLARKDKNEKVIFGSIQSVARAKDSFFSDFSILIVDECHRISLDEKSQYLQVISKLKKLNPKLCILGLTATPYRLGMGWIFEFHSHGFVASEQTRFFKRCVFELPLRYMIDQKYLTPVIKIDAPVACYDFSQLKISSSSGLFSLQDIQKTLSAQKRVTPGIVGHIVKSSENRQGVMIFTSSVEHAREILALLPDENSALVVGDTPGSERDQIIADFKARKLKFLVNVSVLTTGFDAPHVDLIALLRPTESISLYQQIVGRGLRLSPGKKNCLLLDYTGQGYDLFDPEIEQVKPNEDAQIVEVDCPLCGFTNHFWGLQDDEGNVVEHYGRKCKGAKEHPIDASIERCEFRFRFKICDACGAENDIAARVCHSCKAVILDVDERLKKAMELRDAHIMKPDTMLMEITKDKKNRRRLEVSYYDLDAQALKEYFYFESESQIQAFYYRFVRMHQRIPEKKIRVRSLEDAVNLQDEMRMPMFVIARKKKYFWEIREKIFP